MVVCKGSVLKRAWLLCCMGACSFLARGRAEFYLQMWILHQIETANINLLNTLRYARFTTHTTRQPRQLAAKKKCNEIRPPCIKFQHTPVREGDCSPYQYQYHSLGKFLGLRGLRCQLSKIMLLYCISLKPGFFSFRMGNCSSK